MGRRTGSRRERLGLSSPSFGELDTHPVMGAFWSRRASRQLGSAALSIGRERLEQRTEAAMLASLKTMLQLPRRDGSRNSEVAFELD